MFRFLRILTKAVLLTLIEPCEVKVDLADFDLNLQENLLSTLLKNTYSCRNVLWIFWLKFDQMLGMFKITLHWLVLHPVNKDTKKIKSIQVQVLFPSYKQMSQIRPTACQLSFQLGPLLPSVLASVTVAGINFGIRGFLPLKSRY